MYCIRCGVQLVDGQTQCPLCATKMVLPEDLIRDTPLYPKNKKPQANKRRLWPHVVIAAAFLLPMLIVLICNWQLSRDVAWSGYVVGALLVTYVISGLPAWFRNPNPVIFTPCGFAAVGLYVLYIEQMTGGSWFLSFALPVIGGIGLIVTAVVTLHKYVRKGLLYIYGGALMAFGAFMLLMEYLLVITFEGIPFVGWSLYPLVVFGVLGGLLIFLAICRPARDMMERKTFL
ncbi:MAG: hypothetical protein IJW14_02095 [Oscillospiraceae bacterium]|nr:hypothetical protein [Oscillospiraceae bacterium]